MGYVSKKDLVSKLVSEFDYERNKVDGMSREELAALVDTLENGEMKVEEVGEDVDAEEKVEAEDTTPMYGSYEWHDHVMGHFHKDELMDGNPSVDGMRRVCEVLVGEIIESQTNVVGTPNEGNQYRASVVVSIVLDDGNNIKRFDGAADAFSGNAEPDFARHAVALAETRAEGRALKRALRLRKVVSAEEIVDSSKIEMPSSSPNKIVDSQYNFIDILCKPEKNNIDVEKFVRGEHNVNNIKELGYDDASALCNKLSVYKNSPDTIPEDIKGYKPWKDNFG